MGGVAASSQWKLVGATIVQIFPDFASAVASTPNSRSTARFTSPMGYDTREIDHSAINQFVFRVIWLVIGRVGAYDIDDRCIGSAGVVQHGNPVGEPTADMEKCDCG